MAVHLRPFAPSHPAFDALEAFAIAHEQLQAPLLAHVQSVKRRLVEDSACSKAPKTDWRRSAGMPMP